MEIYLLDSVPRPGIGAAVLVTLSVKPISFKTPIEGVFQLGGKFWTADQIPPPLFDPETGDELPIVPPEYQTINFTFEQTRAITYFVPRYDLVVFFRWMQNSAVYGITYVDLGRLARKEEHSYG